MEEIKVDVLASIKDDWIRDHIGFFVDRVKDNKYLLRDLGFLITSKVNNQRAFECSNDMIEMYWNHIEKIVKYLTTENEITLVSLELSVGSINEADLAKEVVPLFELFDIIGLHDKIISNTLVEVSRNMLAIVASKTSLYLS